MGAEYQDGVARQKRPGYCIMACYMTINRFPRLLLTLAALFLAAGGFIHAAAFPKALAVLAGASLPSFYANSFRGLWISDSATLIVLAAAFGFIAARPSAATRWVIVLMALIPAATAIFIYWFVGSFFAAHLLLACSAAVIVAGLQYPAAPQRSPARTVSSASN